MNNESLNMSEDPMPLPEGIYGVVGTDASGSVVEQKGKLSHSLGEYVAYFNQLSSLVGDSLGLHGESELLLLGKRNTLCLHADGVHYGAIFRAKMDYREVSYYLRQLGEEANDVLA